MTIPLSATYTPQLLDATSTPMLQLHQVSYYNATIPTLLPLAAVTVTIQRGESIAIIGNDSSGKDTLLTVLACLALPTSGNYSIYGHDVGTLAPAIHDDLRLRHIGVIFSMPLLLPALTVFENVALPLAYLKMAAADRTKRVMAALAVVGLGAMTVPVQYPRELSPEQGYTVAVARAIVQGPAILLLHEPISALGSAARHDYMVRLQQCNERGLTVIVATNDQEIAAYTRRQIIMRDGQIVHDTGCIAPQRPLAPIIAHHVIDEWLV